MKVLFAAVTSIFILTTSFKTWDLSANKYQIIGLVTGFSDSTLLYLDDVTEGSFKHIDSSSIIGGKFTFQGAIKGKAIKAAIRTKDFQSRCYFWLENTIINFNADKANFSKASIKGSKTQEEQNRLANAVSTSSDPKIPEYLFAKNNPKSILSASILSVYASTWGKDTTSNLYSKFSKELKDSYYGGKIQEYLQLNKDIKIGDKYADVIQQDTTGTDRKLSSLGGKVILLEFWGSWCMPCRKSNPELVKIYNEFNDKGFEVFGVGAETSKEEWVTAIKVDQLPWVNVSDLKGDKNKAALIYGVSYYPTNFLIDKNGTIIARDLMGAELKEKLKQILQ